MFRTVAAVMLVVPSLLVSLAHTVHSSLEAAEPTSLRVYVGTYTRGQSEGIYRFDLDLESGEASPVMLAAEATNPSFVAIHPSGETLYAVGEIGQFEGRSSGSVSAFAIQPNGDLRPLNSKPSRGGGPCHVIVDPAGKHVLVANYGGGSAAVLPIADDGSLESASSFSQHEGGSVNPQRQKGPHAHSINLDPSGRYAVVADLGLDKVLVYRYDAKAGTITPHAVPFVRVAPGGGPRHFAFHTNGKFAYTNNEITSSVTAFRFDDRNGMFGEMQTISTLPDNFASNNSTAEIRVHPNGKFLYVSNRGHDSIASFSIDPDTGKLTPIEHTSSRGQTPRNFNLDPTGQFLLAANQNTHNVTIFRVDQQSGRLEFTGTELEIPSPVCIRFLELQ